jgi:hypothetical protein
MGRAGPAARFALLSADAHIVTDLHATRPLVLPAGHHALAQCHGVELEAEGKIDEAIELYERHVAAGHTTAHPYDRLRTIYERRNGIASAIRVCQADVRAFSENPGKAQRFDDTTAWLRNGRRMVTLPSDQRRHRQLAVGCAGRDLS